MIKDPGAWLAQVEFEQTWTDLFQAYFPLLMWMFTGLVIFDWMAPASSYIIFTFFLAYFLSPIHIRRF